MRFRILHILIFILIVALALAVRSFAYFAQDLGLILIASVAISGVLAFLMAFFGSTIRNSVLWGVLASSTIIAIQIFECLFRTEASKYIWVYVSGSDEVLIYFLVALFTLLASLIIAIPAAFFAAFIKKHWKWK